jgi:hypothetical protein
LPFGHLGPRLLTAWCLKAVKPSSPLPRTAMQSRATSGHGSQKLDARPALLRHRPRQARRPH